MTIKMRDDARWGDKYTCMPVLQTLTESIHEIGLKNNNFNYQIACTIAHNSECTEKINHNHQQNLNTKNVFFSKPVEMFYHPVDRKMGLQKPVVYWVNQ